MDVTAMQALIDTRNQLDRHAAPDVVEWHVAGLSNRWARRAFAAAGFGYPPAKSLEALGGVQQQRPIFDVAAVVSKDSVDAEKTAATTVSRRIGTKDEEAVYEDVDRVSSSENNANNGGNAVSKIHGLPQHAAAVQGINRPWFHIDVPAAVESVIASIEGRLDNGPKAE